MKNVFELIDKTGKTIVLTKERWSHIRKEHPNVDLGEIETTLQNPRKIFEVTDYKHYYFQYFKHKPFPKKFLRIIVKYKNDCWLVMTAHFVVDIRL